MAGRSARSGGDTALRLQFPEYPCHSVAALGVPAGGIDWSVPVQLWRDDRQNAVVPATRAGATSSGLDQPG